MKNKFHIKVNIHDDPEDMVFVTVISVRGLGALLYHGIPLIPKFLLWLAELGIFHGLAKVT